MGLYTVIERYANGVYAIWSHYETLDEIDKDMYEEFKDAPVGTEWTVINNGGEKTHVVGTYRVEKRVTFRKPGALDEAWPRCSQGTAKASRVDVGDGASLVRFY